MRVRKDAWAAAVCAGLLAGWVPHAFPSSIHSPAAVFEAGMHPQFDSANIYSETANAHEDIRQAILRAAAEHKRVLLVFGANWCVDCHLLDLYFHDPGNASLLAANYVLVNVNVGEYDRNLDLARKYGIPLQKGVPALVVLDGAGRVLYVQRNAQFENMRVLDSAAVTSFLQKWKPRQAPIHRSSK